MCLHSHCLGEKISDGIQPHCALKAAKICLKINAIIIIALMTGFGVRTVSKQVVKTTSKIALLNKSKVACIPVLECTPPYNINYRKYGNA